MPSETFYNENSQALKPVSIEVRNALPTLAVQILISRYPNFSEMKNEELILELRNIISDLHGAYQRIAP